MPHHRTPHVAARLALLAGAALALWTGPAVAQNQPAITPGGEGAQPGPRAVEPYYVVITGADALLRCGPGTVWYPVAAPKDGSVLRVDSEDRDWLGVSYPDSAFAVVPAEQVTLSEQGKTATLKTAARLKAFNLTLGARGSWKSLFETDTPAGTMLRVVGTEEGEGGKPAAYRVVPPAQARAFVQTRHVRRATEDEARAYTASLTQTGPATPATAAQPTSAPAPTPTGLPAGQPVAQTPGQSPAGPDASAPTTSPTTSPTTPATTTADAGSLLQPMVPSGATPTGPDATTNPATTPAGPGAAPIATPVNPPATQPTPPATPTLESLEPAFRAVQQQKLDEAEFGEMIAQYEAALDALPTDADSQRTRQALQQRLGILRTRLDLREQLKGMGTLTQEWKERSEAIEAQIANLERSRGYVMVGRLAASAIYDGRRLPLMYRVQSVGGLTQRTLGYIRPEPGLELDRKLGLTIGIAGDAQIDPALRVKLVRPRRVDVLGPQEIPVTPPATTPTTTPTTTDPQPTTTTPPADAEPTPAREASSPE